MLWEQCSCERSFVEALGDAAVRGELTNIPPTPDSTQVLYLLCTHECLSFPDKLTTLQKGWYNNKKDS